MLRLPLDELQRRLKTLAYQMLVSQAVQGTAAPYAWARRRVGGQALQDGLNLGVLVRGDETIQFYHQSLQGYFAVERLGRALQVRNRFERLTKNPVALIRQIGDLGEAGAPAVEALCGALTDSDVLVRRATVDALTQIGDAGAVEPLSAALRDAAVRRSAAAALGAIGDARAVQPLITALRDADAAVCRSAADALGRIGDQRAVGPLMALLSDETELWDDRVCNVAARTLERIGTPEALAAVAAWRRMQDGDG